MKLGNTQSSGNWAELPEGVTVLAVIESGTAKPHPERPDKPRVFLQYEVPEELRGELDLDELDDDTTQSYRTRETYGATYGNAQRRSGLFDRVCDFTGSAFRDTLERWFAAGGEFDTEWLVGCRLKAVIKHNPDKVNKTKMWANVEGSVPDKALAAANLKIIKLAMATDNPRLAKHILGETPAPAPVVTGKHRTAVAEPPEEPPTDDIPF